MIFVADDSHDGEVHEEGREVVEAVGGESERELDCGGSNREACDEHFEPEGGVGAAALADTGGGGVVRGGDGEGKGAVRGEGHVRWKGGRGSAREGGESGYGGHGGAATEWEGGCGDSAERHGEWSEEESGCGEGEGEV